MLHIQYCWWTCVHILLQALSNSIWALAHLKSRGMEVDPLRNPSLMRFMNELAGTAAHALARPHATLSPPGTSGEIRLPEAQRYLALVEREFSCQVSHFAGRAMRSIVHTLRCYCSGHFPCTLGWVIPQTCFFYEAIGTNILLLFCCVLLCRHS